jgi:hypothetical protein
VVIVNSNVNDLVEGDRVRFRDDALGIWAHENREYMAALRGTIRAISGSSIAVDWDDGTRSFRRRSELTRVP